MKNKKNRSISPYNEYKSILEDGKEENRMYKTYANRSEAEGNFAEATAIRRNIKNEPSKKKFKITKNNLKKLGAVVATAAVLTGVGFGTNYAVNEIKDDITAHKEVTQLVNEFKEKGANEEIESKFSLENEKDRKELIKFMDEVFKYENADNLSNVEKLNLEADICNYMIEGNLMSAVRNVIDTKVTNAYNETNNKFNGDIKIEYLNTVGEDGVRGLQIKHKNGTSVYSIYDSLLAKNPPNCMQGILEYAIGKKSIDANDKPEKIVKMASEVCEDLGEFMFSNIIIKDNGNIDVVSDARYSKTVNKIKKQRNNTVRDRSDYDIIKDVLSNDRC